jgi:predicted nucleic acid-binding protein
MSSESDAPTIGLIDTNVFIHAQANDGYTEECLRYLEAAERGDVRARLDPLVAHSVLRASPHPDAEVDVARGAAEVCQHRRGLASVLGAVVDDVVEDAPEPGAKLIAASVVVCHHAVQVRVPQRALVVAHLLFLGRPALAQ